MGRGCTMDEWIHFEKLPEEGRVPNSSYWYVHCRHCARGFEQKQLINPPTKLTGRRSAMRAHLKVCPIYAPQYKLEQRALSAAAAAATAAVTGVAGDGNGDVAEATASASAALAADGSSKPDATSTESTKRKRRSDAGEVSGPRGGRGKHCMMEEWEHFVRLQDEGYIGKSNFFYAICRHCQKAYDDASDDKKTLMVPERMVGRREKMRKHLTLCPYFKGELPALERRTHLRQSGPTSFLPMTTADGIKMVPANALATASVADASSPSASAATASAAVVAAATIEATPSSRLALDEWQYFTRLQRKKDSAYYFARCNFCQHAYESAPESLKTSMTPTIVMGRKSNMQTHLAKCAYVPKDATLFGRALQSSTRDDPLLPAAKRAKITREVDSMVLMEFTIQHRMPFEWVESSSAQKLVRNGSEAHTSTLPSATELRGPILDGLHQSVLQGDLQHLQAASSLVVNEETVSVPPIVVAKVEASRGDDELPSLECYLSSNQACISVEFVRQQDQDAAVVETSTEEPEQPSSIAHFHGLEVARWIEKQLQDAKTSAQIAPKIVTVPVNPAFQRAVKILRARYPDLVFLPHFDHLIAFALRKMLEHPQVVDVVQRVVALYNDEHLHPHLKTQAPLAQWTDFCQLLQELAAGLSTDLQAIVDASIERSAFERVLGLFRAFVDVVGSLRSGSLPLADAIAHIATIFHFADGFDSVRAALEVAWSQCEQPLFVLANALHPHHRLRALQSTELTKPSVLSDASVLYFAQWFPHKPTSLRGDVTSFLHISQPTFADAFVAEFPVLDDYCRYLADNHAELSLLMRQLQANSLISVAARDVIGAASPSVAVPGCGYSAEEVAKLQLLQDRWNIEPSTAPTSASAAASASSDGLGLCAQWIAAIDARLAEHLVDYAELEALLLADPAEETDDDELSVMDTSAIAATTEPLAPLPSQEHDDLAQFASTSLTGARSKRASLAALCRTPDQATI